MASIMDAGSRYDIHPKRKRPAGERLALLALNKVYGREIACEAPRVGKIEREKDTLKITFLHAEGGLTAKSDLRDLFQIVQDKKNLAYTAEIHGDAVALKVTDMKEGRPVTVSFAYVPYVEMSLYNQAGIAARPCAPEEVR